MERVPIFLPGHDHGTPFAQDPSLQYAQSVEPEFVKYLHRLKITNAELEDQCCMLRCQLQSLQDWLYRANMDKARLQEENATQRRDHTMQNGKILMQQDYLQKLESKFRDQRLQAERQRLEMEGIQRSLAEEAAESKKEVQRLQKEKADSEARRALMQNQLEASEALLQKKEEERQEALSSLRNLDEVRHEDLQVSSLSSLALEQHLEEAEDCIELLLKEKHEDKESWLQMQKEFEDALAKRDFLIEILLDSLEMEDTRSSDSEIWSSEEEAEQEEVAQQESQSSLQGAASLPLSQRSTDCPTSPNPPSSDSGSDRSFDGRSSDSKEEVSGRKEFSELQESQSSLQGAASSPLSQRSTDCPTSPNPPSSDSGSDRPLGLLNDDRVHEATLAPRMPNAEDSDQQSQRLRSAFDVNTPEEILTVLLNFLPVAEVVTHTRAVSRFFSDSKVWVAHLFKLMDVDSVLEHSGNGSHPAMEFVAYVRTLVSQGLEKAADNARKASEGFQGYLLWFRGHVKWHAHYPEKSSHFVQVIVECFCRDKRILGKRVGWEMCRLVLIEGISDLRLDIAIGLLRVLSENHLSVEICQLAIDCLEGCRIAFRFLPKNFILKLVELAVEWMGQEGDFWWKLSHDCCCQLLNMSDAILPVQEAHWAGRCVNAMLLAHVHGESHRILAKKRDLMELLSR